MDNKKRALDLINAYLEKQNKTELATQKIELGAIDDLRELITDAKRIIGLQEDGVKWGNKAEKEYKEVKKVVNDAEGITRGAIRQAANLKKESESIFNKVEISAKDLGINVSSIKEYNEAFKLVSKMFENQNELIGWNDFLKKIN